jgi:hypothetical protein
MGQVDSTILANVASLNSVFPFFDKSDCQRAFLKHRQMTNVAIEYLAVADMVSDGQLTGLSEVSHHVGFLAFRGIYREDCDLVEHDAVLQGLGSFHAKPGVFIAV